MTVRRAALYAGGTCLLVAWLSSAASVSLQPQPPPTPIPEVSQEPSVELLAATVQAQARKLKKRLAAAPTPQEPSRNPFAFGTVAQSFAPVSPSEPALPAISEPFQPVAHEPALSLIGIAEEQEGDVLVRTAMVVTDPDTLFIVSIGDRVLDRYKVTGIGPDSMELADVRTGAVRRLILDRQ